MKQPRLTQRKNPTHTERALAAFVGSAKTHVHLNYRRPDGLPIDGMYVPEADTIILYPSHTENSIGVALEEAGHSNNRVEYIVGKDQAKLLGDKLEKAGGLYGMILNWAEDVRIHTQLTKQYPGSTPVIDEYWAQRAAELNKINDVIPGARHLRQVLALYGQCPFKTFQDVLDYVAKIAKEIDDLNIPTHVPYTILEYSGVGLDFGLRGDGAMYPWPIISYDIVQTPGGAGGES